VSDDAATAVRLRQALLVLGAGGILAIAFELASARHWTSAVQLVPWVALGLITAALTLVAARPSRARLHAARVVGGVVLAAAVYGMIMHVKANYDAGPLDGTYGPRWDAAAAMTRVWWALTETVGPSPALAPAALAQVALLVLLATLRHPRLQDAAEIDRRRDEDTTADRGRRAVTAEGT
jgi:hypothetical protein